MSKHAELTAATGTRVYFRELHDAFAPFASELRTRYDAGDSFAAAWAAAAAEATRAGRATAALTPRLGRARPLAERSIGHPDAGAISFGYIVSALADMEVSA